MAKLFVWDFHGVLEKGNELAVRELVNGALKVENFSERFSQEEINKIYGVPVCDYFKHILPKSVDELIHKKLEGHFKSIALNTEPPLINEHIEPSDNAHFLLESIDKSPHTQIVISNVSDEGLNKFLEFVEMERFFLKEHRFGADNKGSRKPKTEILKEFLRDKNFDEIICIGDSPQDLNLIEGCTSYLYANPGIPFKECEFDFKIRDLKDILKELN